MITTNINAELDAWDGELAEEQARAARRQRASIGRRRPSMRHA